jgi:DNA adenine methylase
MGGGAVFFGLAPSTAILSDVNADLMTMYGAVRDDWQAVARQLHALAKAHSEAHYYEVRRRYNRDRGALAGDELAAAFIYLNKTCFNGLHRVNRSGEFNVPFGRYLNPSIVNEVALQAASAALERGELRSGEDFEMVLERCERADFVYMDPPYEPSSRTANFTGYASGGFQTADQVRLRDSCRRLTAVGAKFMLSNSATAAVRELYADFRLDEVTALRSVNCDPAKRGGVRELVIRNY